MSAPVALSGAWYWCSDVASVLFGTNTGRAQRTAAAEVYGRTRGGSSVGKSQKIGKVVATRFGGDYYLPLETEYSDTPGNLDGLATILADIQMAESSPVYRDQRRHLTADLRARFGAPEAIPEGATR